MVPPFKLLQISLGSFRSSNRCQRVGAGDQIVIPIVALHRMKEIWGEDADEFKPERWECIPEAVSSIPGVWGNIFSFIGGARGCIGYRFSLIE